jgi:molecular chaperone IbpA
MRTFDLSTVGFDRLFQILDQAAGHDAPAASYPPYNIEKTGDDAYRVSIAVAGFSEADLSIEARDNGLTVRGDRSARATAGDHVLYQGIAARAFERRFHLADHVSVTGASLENGLLHIDLVREVPEAKKPRVIPIGNGAAAPAQRPTLEAVARAA